MYFFYFSAATAQIKPQNTLKADKRKAAKTIYVIGHANNNLCRYNKCHCSLHARCILKTIKHKKQKQKNNKVLFR